MLHQDQKCLSQECKFALAFKSQSTLFNNLKEKRIKKIILINVNSLAIYVFFFSVTKLNTEKRFSLKTGNKTEIKSPTISIYHCVQENLKTTCINWETHCIHTLEDSKLLRWHFI